MKPHLEMLDNPVWWSLSTRLRKFAECHGNAVVMAEPYGPFAACDDMNAADFGGLRCLARQRGTPAMLMARDLPVGLNVPPSAFGVQLVAERLSQISEDKGVEDLTGADAKQIFELAERTRPGPFERRSHELGEFIGIKREGHLVAMAGQRMRLPGYCEISAVCVDRAYRGRGYGAALVLEMAARIVQNGDWPFLHTYADNKRAIALYERLGFRIRTTVKLLQLNDDVLSHVATRASVVEPRSYIATSV